MHFGGAYVVQSTSLSQEDLTIAEARAHVLTPSKVPGEFETLDGWRVFVVGNEVSSKNVGKFRCTLEAAPMGGATRRDVKTFWKRDSFFGNFYIFHCIPHPYW